MKAVRSVTGRALPVDRANVDTDQIIPARYLKRIERTGYAEGLFAEWRKDPAFVLNDPAYRGAAILVAGRNFGCGSSREHAVWALAEYGFEAVVAPSFADIFRGNCLKSAVVPAAVDEEVVRRILQAVAAAPTIEVTVDVEAREVSVPALGVRAPFPLDDHSRWRLLEGLDDIGLTLGHEAAIAEYERRRPSWLPMA